jgi:DNA-binding CsgD family transcriptional regulator
VLAARRGRALEVAVPRLPAGVAKRVREIDADLGTLVDGAPSAMDTGPRHLLELLAGDCSFAFDFRRRGDRLTIGHWGLARCHPDLPAVFGEYATAPPVPEGWTAYNPARPEPAQRNFVAGVADILRFAGARHRDEVPVHRDCYPRVGLTTADALRVLVCDGPSLLAYVAVFREEPFTPVERRTLQRLVPALQRRLTLERTLSESASDRALLAATFAAISAPAFVTDATGALEEANPAGQRWLEREGRAGRQALADAARRGHDARFELTPVVTPGAPKRFLMVLRAVRDARACAGVCAARWGFTRRQEEVLALVMEGSSNRTIAAVFGISESTVEFHLKAMFEKAQVESRSELAVAAWRST